jgi:4-aminobutyrate aminotransferase-like enzyme
MAAVVVTACNEVGLLLNAVRPHAIRFMPPLTVTQAEIDEAIAILSAVLERHTTS